MTVTRTIQFLGQGYAPAGTEPIIITATLDGNVVYTGTIPTLYTSDIGRLPGDQEVMFTVDLPLDFAGTLPMTVALDNPVGVDVYWEQIMSNYMPIANSVYTQADLAVLGNPASTQAEKLAVWEPAAVPPLSAEDIALLSTNDPAEKQARLAVLTSHNLLAIIGSGPDGFYNVDSDGDARSNVVINGTPASRVAEPTGTWGWNVEFPAEGSGIIAYDLTVSAGLE